MSIRVLAVATPLLALAYAPGDVARDPDPAAARLALANTPIRFQEWQVPWERTRPRDPYVAPDGRIVFVGQQGDYIARLDPATGRFERWPLDPGTGPHNVIVDREGFAWYAGNRAAHIGRMDLRTGEIRKYAMPEGIRDPHTLVWDSKGDIWFTAQGAGYVGKLTLATGEVRVVEVGQGMRPYGIVVDANDRPWFVTMGSNKLGTVDPATMELTLYDTPDPGSRTRRLGITSDGRVWWVDAARGYLGVFDPATQQMRQWQTPGGERAGLYATAVDAKDRIWYVETGLQPNRFVGFDPRTEAFFSVTEVPSGGGAVRHMVYDRGNNVIWFGTDTHTIGKAILPE